MPCRKYLKASVSFPGCRKEGQAQILIGCLGLGGWGRFPDPRLDKGGRAKSLTCVTWGRPPESAICKGERSELSRVHPTPCLALTYLHRLCDQTYCPAPALAGPTGSGGPAKAGEQGLTFRKVVVVGSSLELHSTWEQGASFSRARQPRPLLVLGSPCPSC